jgi:hypothetical protein
LKNVKKSADQASGKGLGMGGGLIGLGSAMKGLGVAFAGSQLVGMIGDLNKSGIEADRADKVFQNLSKTLGSYNDVMDSLRISTNNVIDDTSLQLTANKLLSSGMVKTQKELEKTIGLCF